MFDDMISTAGSICGAAEVVHEHGAKAIYAAATHGLLVGPAIERLKNAPFKAIVITDSIPLTPGKMLPEHQGALGGQPARPGDQADPPQRVGQHDVPIGRRRS